MFVDEATLTAKGGDGGNGCRSFRREKYVPRGGPNGGDGGKGGDLILVAEAGITTLIALRFRNLLRADRGRHGMGANKTGRCGNDMLVKVPVGTVIFDEDKLQLLADLNAAGDQFIAAAGGRGGRGNARFSSSVNRAPTRFDTGEPGQQRVLKLELKLLADVGLLGFPNAGKSTLISRISAARPKIADYPFTTLVPNLGVVDCGGYRSFVVADIPGLIEGAHRGAGLGHRFLRHIERCRLLLHLVDPTETERDPLDSIQTLNEELKRYRPQLADKPQILVLTKSDVTQDAEPVAQLQAYAKKIGLPCISISSIRGDGLNELVGITSDRLDRLAPIEREETADDQD
jgi:GTP-binding protein